MQQETHKSSIVLIGLIDRSRQPEPMNAGGEVEVPAS